MTPTNIVTLVAVAASCATALLVGYWHRKQLRQLELYRKDPSVGLKPPPAAAVAFIKHHYDIIFGVLPPIGSLILLFISGPLTRTAAVLIVLNSAGIFVNLLFRTERRSLERFSKVMTILERHTHSVEALAARIHALESSNTKPSQG
jgi:hypothetical protein